MFDRTDDATVTTAPDATITVDTTTTADRPDYGIFSRASITSADGTATVVVPLRRGKLTLETDTELLAAWAIDNAASAVTTEAKKHKP
ncbi:MAG: hypothetical protein HY913_04235 [Desulfomonile tiedjei]|nr:hypothetical protein [Desulfomonile tiedjei]